MKTHYLIMARIAAMFVIVIFTSFIPELSPDFFGDWLCQGRIKDAQGVFSGCDHTMGSGDYSTHNSTWHWGYRHYIWAFMGIVLFIYNAFLIINIIDKTTKEQ